MSTDNNFTNNVRAVNENTIQSAQSKNRKKRDRKPDKTKKQNSKLQFGCNEPAATEEPQVKRAKLEDSGTKSNTPDSDNKSQKSLTKEEIEISKSDQSQNDQLLKEMESLRTQLRNKEIENEKNAQLFNMFESKMKEVQLVIEQNNS